VDDSRPDLTVIQGGFGKAASASAGVGIKSPAPPPGALNTQERRVWEYICAQLREVGIEHGSAGLTIKIICRTYVDWLHAVKLCEDEGRYKISGNGNQYEAPHSYTEKQLKRDLLKWLPEACLTIPSLAKAKGKESGNGQGDLFGELLSYANGHPG